MAPKSVAEMSVAGGSGLGGIGGYSREQIKELLQVDQAKQLQELLSEVGALKKTVANLTLKDEAAKKSRLAKLDELLGKKEMPKLAPKDAKEPVAVHVDEKGYLKVVPEGAYAPAEDLVKFMVKNPDFTDQDIFAAVRQRTAAQKKAKLKALAELGKKLHEPPPRSAKKLFHPLGPAKAGKAKADEDPWAVNTRKPGMDLLVPNKEANTWKQRRRALKAFNRNVELYTVEPLHVRSDEEASTDEDAAPGRSSTLFSFAVIGARRWRREFFKGPRLQEIRDRQLAMRRRLLGTDGHKSDHRIRPARPPYGVQLARAARPPQHLDLELLRSVVYAASDIRDAAAAVLPGAYLNTARFHRVTTDASPDGRFAHFRTGRADYEKLFAFPFGFGLPERGTPVRVQMDVRAAALTPRNVIAFGLSDGDSFVGFERGSATDGVLGWAVSGVDDGARLRKAVERSTYQGVEGLCENFAIDLLIVDGANPEHDTDVYVGAWAANVPGRAPLLLKGRLRRGKPLMLACFATGRHEEYAVRAVSVNVYVPHGGGARVPRLDERPDRRLPEWVLDYKGKRKSNREREGRLRRAPALLTTSAPAAPAKTAAAPAPAGSSSAAAKPAPAAGKPAAEEKKPAAAKDAPKGKEEAKRPEEGKKAEEAKAPEEGGYDMFKGVNDDVWRPGGGPYDAGLGVAFPEPYVPPRAQERKAAAWAEGGSGRASWPVSDGRGWGATPGEGTAPTALRPSVTLDPWRSRLEHGKPQLYEFPGGRQVRHGEPFAEPPEWRAPEAARAPVRSGPVPRGRGREREQQRYAGEAEGYWRGEGYGGPRWAPPPAEAGARDPWRSYPPPPSRHGGRPPRGYEAEEEGYGYEDEEGYEPGPGYYQPEQYQGGYGYGYGYGY